MKNKRVFLFILVAVVLTMCNSKPQKSSLSAFETSETLQDFFQYRGDGSVIISGHRGNWLYTEYPDNSLEGLQYTTEVIPDIFFEVDPRLTKDSVIVLMHDAALDRTTNAIGKLIDYSWEELDSVRLKDYKGDITSFKIPTLEEAIRWSIEKTVLNLDRKDVPPHMIVDLIKKCNAEKHIMLTVHTGEQIRYYYDMLPDVMFSVHIRNQEEYDDIASAGVPWRSMIAYVGPTIDERNAELVQKLHDHGVRCMISVAPTHDRIGTSQERAVKYRDEILAGADIIETDIPQELWEVLQQVKNETN